MFKLSHISNRRLRHIDKNSFSNDGDRFITRIIKGYKNKNINSNKAYKGLRKKVVVLFIMVAASQMDIVLQGIGIRTAVAMFYVATEFLSILENAAILGIPIPTKLKQALEQCRDKQDVKSKESNQKLANK